MDETGGTVIIGAGIIGCATAYYLSSSSASQIHLIERSPELFASASGKAGGFLAEDWFNPATAELGELSFRLHKELAEEFGGREKWGYMKSTGTSLVDGGDEAVEEQDLLENGRSRGVAAGVHEVVEDGSGRPMWLKRRKGDRVEMLSEEGGVAQVDPLRLSRFLLDESVSRGVRLHHPARATRVVCNEKHEISGLAIEDAKGMELVLPCSHLLIAAGAWTPGVFASLFPSSSTRIPVSSYAGHSLVVRCPEWKQSDEAKGCHAIFTTMRNGFSPEIFSRIGEEIYIAGLNSSSIALPEIATEANIDKRAIGELVSVAKKLLATEDVEIVREGLCFRPVTRSGNPVLAKVEDVMLGEGMGTVRGGGVYVCAGHGPWGISLSLGTGKVIAEMLEGSGEPSADASLLGLK